MSDRALTLYYGTGSIIATMRIGELSKRAGVNIQTIRFYERQRLLPAPARTAAGYRTYADRDLATVSFIKQCQQLGFTLKEIKELLDVHRSLASWKQTGRASSGDAGRLFRIVSERLGLIDQKIQLLSSMRARLAAAFDAGKTRLAECPASVQPRDPAAPSGKPL